MESITIVRLWHAALALVTGVAVVLQLGLTIDRGTSLVNFFSYFTIQSNILIFAAALLVAIDPTRAEPWFQILRLGGLVGITVTGIVYSTILAGSLKLEGLDVLCNALLHYVAPAASVIGYVLLRPRTSMTRVAWWSLAWPIAWLVYTLLRAEITSPTYPITETRTATVPYDFLNIDEYGGGSVAVSCLGVTVIAILLAALYVRLGRVKPSES